jgi:hypothetical protein
LLILDARDLWIFQELCVEARQFLAQSLNGTELAQATYPSLNILDATQQ